MNLTNKRETYDVEHSGQSLVLTGTVVILTGGRIQEMNGMFKSSSGEYIGGFSYNEQEDARVNKNINSIPESKQESGLKLLDEAILMIKEQLNNQ